MSERHYLYNTKKIKFDFYQNPKDFVVDELPLSAFKSRGNYLILQVKKIELTTWDMVAHNLLKHLEVQSLQHVEVGRYQYHERQYR